MQYKINFYLEIISNFSFYENYSVLMIIFLYVYTYNLLFFRVDNLYLLTFYTDEMGYDYFAYSSQ